MDKIKYWIEYNETFRSYIVYNSYDEQIKTFFTEKDAKKFIKLKGGKEDEMESNRAQENS